MFTPHPRLAIALAVSMLAIVSSCPAFAKPQSASKVKATIVSQSTNKTAASNDPFAAPVDTVIADAKRKLSNADSTSLTASASKPKSAGKVAPLPIDRVKPAARKPTAKKPGSGTSAFTDLDRIESRSEDFSAVNELIE